MRASLRWTLTKNQTTWRFTSGNNHSASCKGGGFVVKLYKHQEAALQDTADFTHVAFYHD